MSRALLLLPLLAGCLTYHSVDYVVDLSANKATFTYHDFTGDGQDDFDSFVENLGSGQLIAEFPKATLLSIEPVAEGEHLDVVVALGFTDPYDVGIRPWDKRTPYRFCAPNHLVITETNADFRDPDGCAVWKRGAKILRIRAEQASSSGDPSLLSFFQSWDAAGRPPVSHE